MIPTLALVAGAWLLSQPSIRRSLNSESLAALAVTGLVLLALFYGQQFK